MPASFFEALELIGWVRASVSGWRYLLSRSFRRETHVRWKHQSAFGVLWDIVCGAAGIAVTLLLAYVAISLFAGWDWPKRLVSSWNPGHL